MTMAPAELFRNLRLTLLRNTFRAALERSLVRVLSIVVCSLIIWAMIFYVSWRGFHELKTRWDFPLDLRMIEMLFDFLFLALTILLIFSTGIILYSSLFVSPESWFLLSSPVPDDHVFAYKYQGAVAFSSWGFVLLGSPILIAYGIEVGQGAPWYFYVVLPTFFVGFVLLPGSVGALVALLLVNLVPKRRRQMLTVLVLLTVAAAAWLIARSVLQANQSAFGSRAWIDGFLGEINAARERIVPVQWIGRGLKAAALHEPGAMLYYLALVWSNGLLSYLGVVWVAKRLYRRGFNRVATGGSLRRRYGGSWLDSIVERTTFFLNPQTRLLIVKDFRTFRRDPAQWLQVLIFMGLGVLYFSNMRRFYERDIGKPFQNGISLLTLTATAFLMCAYNGRFIFPLLSLEGRKFWILGLLPLTRERLLRGKFYFAAGGSLVLSETLIVFSDLMLLVPWQILMAHVGTVAILAFGLSGLSVGLGACMPNFRETDPSKISVGFGGTLNLVAGLLYLVMVIVLMAAPFHIELGLHGSIDGIGPWWLWALHGLGLILGAAGFVFVLRAGARNLRGMEF